jgi:endonuclease YncB( thermonuclease family)
VYPCSSDRFSSAITGTIVSVGDGDTVRVRTADTTLTVRLICVDAPELKQRPYGQSSANRLKQLLPVGQSVTLQVVDTDRYGRSVAKVYTGSTSINLALVQEGQAVVYRQYLGGCPELRDRLLSAEANAKQRRLGLWAQANPVMPWDFRHLGHAAKPYGGSAGQTLGERRSHSTKLKSPQTGTASKSSFDWSKAQQMIDSGNYSTGVNSAESSYGGSFSNSGSGGNCDSPSDTDSAGRRCGGRAASEKPGGR